MIEFLRSPWSEHFDFLINQVRSSLVVSSPYIGREPCNRILAIKATREKTNQFSFLLLTDLSRDTLLSGATDISAICDIADTFQQMEIRFLPSIHAKVYVADEKLAVVTSGNMTKGGLLSNFEYGVKVDGTNLVRKIKLDITEYAALGTRIDQTKLKFLSQISSDLNRIRSEAERSVKGRLRAEFEYRLNNFDEEIIRTRVAGRSPHAIFADAILFLLSRNPMSTAKLHPLIQRIHPDLCDDKVDRIIDGKHFVKNGSMRSEQLSNILKKQVRLNLEKEFGILGIGECPLRMEIFHYWITPCQCHLNLVS